MNTIKIRLKEFKLSGIHQSIEERLDYAKKQRLGYRDFISLLLEDEYSMRQENSFKKRYHQAKLPVHKTMEEFDFSFQPSIDKKLINDLLTCQFIEEKQNVVFIGNPGVGKTHLSIAIGLRALQKGYKVLFTSVAEMLSTIHMGKADNSYYRKVQFYLKPDLLIMDELGFKKIPGYSADDFFEVIAKRYERGSIIVTTNKTFEQWSEIFADSVLTSAIFDRIAHYSSIVKIKGKSYRTKMLKKNGEKN